MHVIYIFKYFIFFCLFRSFHFIFFFFSFFLFLIVVLIFIYFFFFSSFHFVIFVFVSNIIRNNFFLSFFLFWKFDYSAVNIEKKKNNIRLYKEKKKKYNNNLTEEDYKEICALHKIPLFFSLSRLLYDGSVCSLSLSSFRMLKYIYAYIYIFFCYYFVALFSLRRSRKIEFFVFLIQFLRI